MDYVLSDETVDKFVEYGVNVWEIEAGEDPYETAKAAIAKTREFFNLLGLPATLGEVGIGEEKLAVMADKLDGLFTDTYVPLTGAQVLEIYKGCL